METSRLYPHEMSAGTATPRRRPGARSKLTPRRLRRLLDALRAGNYNIRAAEFAGVPRETVRLWRRRGEELLGAAWAEGTLNGDLVDDARRAGVGISGLLRRAGWDERDALLAELAEEIPRAEAEAEVHLVARWSLMAERDWRAAAALASRRWPERWRNAPAIEVVGPEGDPMRFSVAGPDLAQVIADVITSHPDVEDKAAELLALIHR